MLQAMLKVSSISDIRIHTPEWRRARLAKFTSSTIHLLMSDKFLTEKCVALIYEKVGEEVSGVPAQFEVDTHETRWGILYEGDAIKKMGAYLGADFFVTQKLIAEPNGRTGSTPDALNVKQKYADGYDVETIEVKCYPSYPHYIECVLCETPQQLKNVDKKLYWQVIDQMDNCGALKGYAVLYHPDFKAGGFKVIQFRKYELLADFALLKDRKLMAINKFYEILEKMLLLTNP